MSPHDTDSWEGAIVRGRDGRKGRVLQDHRPLFGGQSILTVHWETDTEEPVSRSHVTMLRPPIGYRPHTARHAALRKQWPWALVWEAAALLAALGFAVAILMTGWPR